MYIGIRMVSVNNREIGTGYRSTSIPARWRTCPRYRDLGITSQGPRIGLTLRRPSFPSLRSPRIFFPSFLPSFELNSPRNKKKNWKKKNVDTKIKGKKKKDIRGIKSESEKNLDSKN